MFSYEGNIEIPQELFKIMNSFFFLLVQFGPVDYGMAFL